MNEIKLEKRTPEEMEAWLAGFAYAANFFMPAVDKQKRDAVMNSYDNLSLALNDLLYARNQRTKK